MTKTAKLGLFSLALAALLATAAAPRTAEACGSYISDEQLVTWAVRGALYNPKTRSEPVFKVEDVNVNPGVSATATVVFSGPYGTSRRETWVFLPSESGSWRLIARDSGADRSSRRVAGRSRRAGSR